MPNLTTFSLVMALSAVILLSQTATSQLSLTNSDQAHVIDLSANIAGVLNGPFTANTTSVGSGNPGAGDLNANAWHILLDGSSTNAINQPSVFPSTLIAGEGLNQFPPLPSVGFHATNINGQRAFGIHPSGSNFTSGAITLRIQNNTGAAINSLDVAYDLFVLNDRDRSNSVNLYYSTTNANADYELIPDAAIVSPEAADPSAVPVNNPVDVNIAGLNVSPGGYIYIRWVFEDVDGSGERDEFILLNMSFTPSVSLEPFVSIDNDVFYLHQILGEPGVTQSFELFAGNLTGAVIIESFAPFELSTNGDSFSSTLIIDPIDGDINELEVFIRINGDVPGNFLDDIQVNSAGTGGLIIEAIGAISPPIYINEFMATNSSTIADEFGEFDDWIELYNASEVDVNLAGYYISDDIGNLTKYRIPLNSTVANLPAEGWKMIWADDQSSQGDLHASFALSALGEDVVLTGIDGLTIIDFYSFDQADSDVSEGRETDGGEPWILFATPTPNASNNQGAPFLGVSPVGLSGFQQELGSPSATQSFNVNGQNLFENVELTVSGNYEISLNETDGFSTSLTIEINNGETGVTPIYVRLNANEEGQHLGVVSVTSAPLSAEVTLQGNTSIEITEFPTLFINEFMASNDQTIADENGEFDDWIEIYNPNAFSVDLAGYYISDDLTNLTKYQIPANSTEAVIPALGFLLIWADNADSQGDLHATFALSANGEDVVLTAPDAETIIDSYTYESATTDVSEGRNGDGAPDWVFFTTPTPNASNGPVLIEEMVGIELVLYPNPVGEYFIIESSSEIIEITLFSMTGQAAYTAGCSHRKEVRIDLPQLPSGIYIARILTREGMLTQRFIKQ